MEKIYYYAAHKEEQHGNSKMIRVLCLNRERMQEKKC